MNSLDIILIGCALIYALSGYQQGFILGAASTFGLIAGAFFGIQVTPLLLDRYEASVSVSVAAVLLVLALAFVGQACGAYVGQLLRSHITWTPARTVDAVSGAALSVAAMLVIAWVLALAVSGAQMRGLNEAVRNSTVLGVVDDALPAHSSDVLNAFNSLVNSSRFPRYLEPFAREHIRDVAPPSVETLNRPGVRAAQHSVVKILGDANCDRALEGSGFVYAPGRVMTNAHVVGGVANPVVRLDDTDYDATVVYYDPDVDVAVLAVDGLDAQPLSFAPEIGSGDAAAVLGYPENGPFDAQPARVRDQQRLRSPDIYGDGVVYRDTLSIRSLVRSGNSGGPLIDAAGDVAGVVFAASVTDSDTGYALTVDQVAAAATRGRSANDSVSTGACAE